MKLTDGERLIIVMLAETMSALKLKGEIDPDTVKRFILNKDDWALGWIYPSIFEGEQPSESVIKETVEILEMWSFVEYSIKHREGSEAKEAAKFRDTHFSGFDGNNDPHGGVAHTLIHDLGRWSEFKDHPMNSHSRVTLARYRTMLPKYKAAMENCICGPLPFEALCDILN